MTGRSRTTRLLTAADFDQGLRLSMEAFGEWPPSTPPPTADTFPLPGRHSWGTLEGDRLVARVVGREYHSWWHGAEVPTCGIAGVAVVAEARGEGLLEGLLRVVLEEARQRGEVVSTLYPTAPGIYRRLGYEVVTSLDDVDLPTLELTAVRPPSAGVRTRRATAADVPAVRAAYDAWAAAQNGPLTRRGVSFGAFDEELVAGPTGVTLALADDDRVVGYAVWDRGEGSDPSARIAVRDLVTLGPDAARALWRLLGTYSSVVPTVRLTTSGTDLARLLLPHSLGRPVNQRPYMLRVHDVAGAFSALPLHAVGPVTVELAVAGDPLGTMDGGYRLTVADGRTTCERADVPADAPRFTPQGLALAWSGAQSCGSLRLAGHLTGSARHDADLDALLGGRQVHVRDYF